MRYANAEEWASLNADERSELARLRDAQAQLDAQERLATSRANALEKATASTAHDAARTIWADVTMVARVETLAEHVLLGIALAEEVTGRRELHDVEWEAHTRIRKLEDLLDDRHGRLRRTLTAWYRFSVRQGRELSDESLLVTLRDTHGDGFADMLEAWLAEHGHGIRAAATAALTGGLHAKADRQRRFDEAFGAVTDFDAVLERIGGFTAAPRSVRNEGTSIVRGLQAQARSVCQDLITAELIPDGRVQWNADAVDEYGLDKVIAVVAVIQRCHDLARDVRDKVELAHHQARAIDAEHDGLVARWQARRAHARASLDAVAVLGLQTIALVELRETHDPLLSRDAVAAAAHQASAS